MNQQARIVVQRIHVRRSPACRTGRSRGSRAGRCRNRRRARGSATRKSMLAVGKPCTQTNAGAPGVPQRRVKTLTSPSASAFAAVVDRQWISVPPLRHSSKMAIRNRPGTRSARRRSAPHGWTAVSRLPGRCRLAGAEVAVEARMAATGDQEADAGSGRESVRDGVQFDAPRRSPSPSRW